MEKGKKPKSFIKNLNTPKKYLEPNTWSYLIISGIVIAGALLILAFCASKVYSLFVEAPEETTAKAVVEANSKQFIAKIHPDILADKPLVTDGRVLLKLVIENIGKESDFEIPPSSVISEYQWYEESSELELSFIDSKGGTLWESKTYPITSIPITPWNKSDEINLNEEIPLGAVSTKISISCTYTNESSPCKDPKVGKLIYTLTPNLRILIIDASRTTDSIDVPIFRSEIEKIYGNSNFLKAAASSKPIWPSYMKGPMLLYGKGYKIDSDITKQLESALHRIYKQKNYITSVFEMTPHNLEIWSDHLSDSVKDGDNESDHQWVNLDIKKNRFSPNIFIKNPDKIDFVIFLPSNT